MTSPFVLERHIVPRFSISPQQKYKVQLGGSVNITCVAVGSPMPNVKWQKGMMSNTVYSATKF